MFMPFHFGQHCVTTFRIRVVSPGMSKAERASAAGRISESRRFESYLATKYYNNNRLLTRAARLAVAEQSTPSSRAATVRERFSHSTESLALDARGDSCPSMTHWRPCIEGVLCRN